MRLFHQLLRVSRGSLGDTVLKERDLSLADVTVGIFSWVLGLASNPALSCSVHNKAEICTDTEIE